MLKIVERVAGEIADEPDGRAAVPGAPRLGAVLDEDELMLARDGREGGEIAGVAREMHRHDGPGLGGDGAADGSGIQLVSSRVEVGKHGHALLVKHADDGAHVGDRRDDDLVARAQAQRGDGDVEGGRAGGAGLAVFQRVMPAKLLDQGRGLRSFPIKERRLLHHVGEPGELGGAPALRLRGGFIHDGLENGRSGGAHGNG